MPTGKPRAAWGDDRLVVFPWKRCGYKHCDRESDGGYGGFIQKPAPARFEKVYCCKRHKRLAKQARLKKARALRAIEAEGRPRALKARPDQTCQVCGELITPKAGPGRPPKFCREACLKKAARDRRRAALEAHRNYRRSAKVLDRIS